VGTNVLENPDVSISLNKMKAEGFSGIYPSTKVSSVTTQKPGILLFTVVKTSDNEPKGQSGTKRKEILYSGNVCIPSRAGLAQLEQ
jgi:hypothetical protein